VPTHTIVADEAKAKFEYRIWGWMHKSPINVQRTIIITLHILQILHSRPITPIRIVGIFMSFDLFNNFNSAVYLLQN